MRAAVFTLGCKVNQYESGAIVTRLRELGLEADEGLFAADLYVINTCSVTAEADKKSRQTVARALKYNPAAKIIIVGCSSQNDASRFFDRPEVTAVFGSGGKIQNITDAVMQLVSQKPIEERIEVKQNHPYCSVKEGDNIKEDVSLGGEFHFSKPNGGMLENADESDGNGINSFDEQNLPRFYEDDMTPTQSKTRGHVKIQDGCDNFCSYCRVPYLRGRSRSRGEDAIIAETLRFARTSKEIVLTGIDISSYGKNNGSSLSRLVALLGAALRTGRASGMTDGAERNCRAGDFSGNIGELICGSNENYGGSFTRKSDMGRNLSGMTERNCRAGDFSGNIGELICGSNENYGGSFGRKSDMGCNLNGNINLNISNDCKIHNRCSDNSCGDNSGCVSCFGGASSRTSGADQACESGVAKSGRGTRVRLGSLECGVINDDLLKAMRDYNFCDHFHLSLQSGSDTVLARMNRHYSTTEYLDKVNLIRKYFPYAGITTDVIAGFPEESDAEHRQTAAFLQKVGFSDVHVFPYSPRRGTKAFVLPQLDKSVRSERASELSVIAEGLKADFIKKNLGRVCEVLAEDREEGFVAGFTSNYIKVYTRLVSGEMREQRLVEAFGAGVSGENPD